MSRKRQALKTVQGPDGSVLVRTFPGTFLHGYRSEPHRHEWDQLTYAAEGVITVSTAAGTWLVPPHRAVWVPAGTEHIEEMSSGVAARSLFFVAGLSQSLPRDCSAVNVPPLLRELILHACSIGALDSKLPAQASLIGVILDQLSALAAVPLQLPAPRDPRAMRIAALLQKEPGSRDSLQALSRKTGASKRTIERLFRAETSMPFRQWRQRVRLIGALRLLASGESVTNVALEAGYESTSAFIAMFKKALGVTPRRYFSTAPAS